MTTLDVTSLEYPDSSLVKTVAYDDVTGKLYLALNDSVYAYSNVLASVYEDLVASDSAGHFYSTSVRGKYPSTFVGYADDIQVTVRPIEPVVDETPATALYADAFDTNPLYEVTIEVTTNYTVKAHGADVHDAVRRAEDIIQASLENDETVDQYIMTTTGVVRS